METGARQEATRNAHHRAHANELMARGDWPDAILWLEGDLQDLFAAVDAMRDAEGEEADEIAELAALRFADAFRCVRMVKSELLRARHPFRCIEEVRGELGSLDDAECASPPLLSTNAEVATPQNVPIAPASATRNTWETL
jgi:hypothetical protein